MHSDLEPVNTHEDAAKETLSEILKKVNGYWIPSGVSTHPLGGLGYARWAFEIEEQERDMHVFFDVIVVALMSGSSLTGIVAGMKLAAKLKAQRGGVVKKRRIIGVQAGPKDR